MEKTPRSPVFNPRRHTVVAVILVVALYLLPIAGRPGVPNPNELVRLELALAMAMWSSVELESPARIYGLSEDVARRDGRVLADKAPGLSLAAVPLVWAAGVVLPSIPATDFPQYWPLRHLTTALLVCLGMALLCFFIAAKIPDLHPSGWIPLALIAALGTPMWTYATVFFGHAPAAALIAISWILLLRPFTDAEIESDRTAFVGGLAAGFAVATEYPTLLLVVVVYATLLVRRTPKRQLIPAFIGLAAGILPALIYHQLAFGAPWLTGYAFKADPGFRDIHATGLIGVSLPTLESLWGVLFSPSRGLFFFSPILLLAPLGLWVFKRRRGWRDVAPLTTAIVVYLVFAAGFVDWQAGWCAAARHLVPAIPLLVIPTMAAMAALAGRRWTLLLLTIGVAVSAARSLLTLVITPFFPPEFSQPLSQLVFASLKDGVVAPNLVTATTGLPAWIAWVTAFGLTLILLIWALGRLARGSEIFIAITMVLVMAGQASWLMWHHSPGDPALETIRGQWLVGLGHAETAAGIETGSGTTKTSDQTRP